MILAINWTVDSQLIDGWSTPNLYGLLFVTGLFLGFYVVKRMFQKENISEDKLDKLLVYMVLATIIGARLGHVLFYGPYFDGYDADGYWHEGYFSHPLNILKIWEGGLASHGGAMAILVALYLYSKRVSKMPMLWILDRIVAPIAIAGCFIRLGNLVNHEIVGNPTDLPWGFIFNKESTNLMIDTNGDGIVEHVPRHPAQLYEAISYVFIFIVLMYMYWKTKAKEKQGLIFGVFLILLFGARFLVEIVKVGQADRDAGLIINTGQWLSIPFVLFGIVLLFYVNKKNKA